MGSISRYIFPTTFSAFLLVLVNLTAVVCVTQVLHYFNLVTSQGQTILSMPIFLAALVSLRFFRLGWVQKMVLRGVAAGFLLYILSKVTDDLSKAELMSLVAAAWVSALAGGLTGVLALLYQEDG